MPDDHERWIGRTDARLEQGERERVAAAADALRREERADARHREIVELITRQRHDQAGALQTLTNRVALLERRIDTWEDRGGMVKRMGASLIAGGGVLLGWIVNHWWKGGSS